MLRGRITEEVSVFGVWQQYDAHVWLGATCESSGLRWRYFSQTMLRLHLGCRTFIDIDSECMDVRNGGSLGMSIIYLASDASDLQSVR